MALVSQVKLRSSSLPWEICRTSVFFSLTANLANTLGLFSMRSKPVAIKAGIWRLYEQCGRDVSVCLTADVFMDHLSSTLLPWTRLTSLARFVLSDGTPAPFLCCDSLTCSAALMQLCHAERAHSFIPCLLTSRGQGSRRQGWLPSSGTGLLQSHCPSLLLKSWDELRGSVLPGLLGSLLHAGPCLGCKGFGWKLVHLPGEFNFSLSNSMTSKDVPSEQCGGLWQWLYGRKSVLVLSLFGK